MIKLKAEIFDIIAEQGKHQLEINKLEEKKNELLLKLQELENKSKK